jgi:hypothetical protein
VTNLNSEKKEKFTSSGKKTFEMGNKSDKKQGKKGFRMMTVYFSEELQENHYLPQPIVSEYINSLVLNYERKNSAF